MAPEQPPSPLVQHAADELRRAGLVAPEADDGGALARHVLALIQVLAAAEGAGLDALRIRVLFHRLSQFGPLTPLTADPAEWMDRRAEGGTGRPLWQSRRNPAAFSDDGGQTWYVLDAQGHRLSEQEATADGD